MIDKASTPTQPPQSQGTQQKHPRSSNRAGYVRFADMLGASARSPGDKPQMLDPRSATKPYSVGADIGQDAVRFDARPIVGPVSENMAEAAAVLPSRMMEPPAVGDALTGAPPKLHIEPQSLFSDLLATGSPAGGPYATKALASHPPADAQKLRPMALLNILAPTISAPGAKAPPMSMTVQASDGTATPKHTQLVGKFVPNANSFAQVVVLPREIRVSVKGAQLQADEIESLLRDIRQALNSHGLASHKIIFKHSGREA